MIALVALLVIVAVAIVLLNGYVSVPEPIKTILNIVVAVALVCLLVWAILLLVSHLGSGNGLTLPK